jgi:hypothetical protein
MKTQKNMAQFVPMGIPTDSWEVLATNNYKNIVDEEFQHHSYLNFRALVRKTRMISNKIMFFDDW